MALSLAATTLAHLSYCDKLVGVLGIISISLLFWRITHKPFYPALPLAGEPPHRKWFSLSSRLRYYRDCESLFNEAYHTVSLEFDLLGLSTSNSNRQ